MADGGKGLTVQQSPFDGDLAAAPIQAAFALRRGAGGPAPEPLADVVALSSVRQAGKPRSSKSTAAGGSKARRPTGSPSARSATPGDTLESAPTEVRIGVISDNHGYLDPEVLEIFAGVTHIIHAGDIVDPEILRSLETVAPVTAVSGNMDTGDSVAALPRDAVGEVAGVRFLVGHKRKRLLKDLATGKIAGLTAGPPDLVVYGHDHVPAAAWVDNTLFLNPGSASAPHEEDDGPTVAIVSVRPAGLAVCFVPLERRDEAQMAKERPRKG
jgi:putative phosphoesterase